MGTARLRADRWVGSFTAAAGCVIYDGGAWPEEYNGDYFTTEPTINVIHHTRLTPDGSSYTAKRLPGREETEFIRSKDLWWRPIEVRVGPDGAMYVGDFYNQAVIHNDTRGPDHNKVNAAVRPTATTTSAASGRSSTSGKKSQRRIWQSRRRGTSAALELQPAVRMKGG